MCKKYQAYILLIQLLLCYLTTTAQKGKILVFSKTQGYRHESIIAGQKLLSEFGIANDFVIDTTENADAISENNLKKYRAIVFLNTSGAILDSKQKNDFERFIQAGGGFVGIHAAADTEYQWAWYHKMLGATFESHPDSPNERVGKVQFFFDDATKNYETELKDEFYNFKLTSFDKEVKCWAKLDENSYQGGNMGENHPISWSKTFEGGRIFYTGLGHNEEIYKHPIFKTHLFAGLNWVLNNKIDWSKAKNVVSPEENRFQKNILSTKLNEPIELAPLPNGKILLIERKGDVKVYLPSEKQTLIAASINVFSKYEYGLLGISIDPNFSQNNWIYLYYTPSDTDEKVQYLARYVFDDSTNKINLDSKKIILTVPIKKNDCCHTGGSMAWDSVGNLFLSTGDDTSPGDSEGYSPIDFREGRKGFDALGTAGNTNDFRGKILRIKPTINGKYEIPNGNLFPQNTPNTKPEIFIMGCRNPYRISFDKKTNTLYWGDIGPDAGKASSLKGPEGYVEFNAATKAGNYGWPMFIAANLPYHQFDFTTKVSGEKYNAENPVNNSPNNTGLKVLPPAQKPYISYSYIESQKFPILGKGGCNPMAGPVYYEQDYVGNNKFPAYFNKKQFVYEWMRDWVIAIDHHGDNIGMEKLFKSFEFSHPIDLDFGFDGTLYILDYGTNWFQANDEAALYQLEYVRGNRKPIVHISANKMVGQTPLVVQFNSKGTFDPDGDKLTYYWQLGQQKSTLPNPKFTFTKSGEYEVILTATDINGNSSSQQISIIAGNSYPKLSINVVGNQTFLLPDKTVKYQVKVNDKEDGTLNKGISKDEVTVSYSFIDGYDKTLLEQGHQMNIIGLKGKKLIESSDCKACHSINKVSIGPSYEQIAERYEQAESNVLKLANKIISGGAGNWGEHPMAAHPQISKSDAQEMVNYILNIKSTNKQLLPVSGTISNIQKAKTLLIKASYTDHGKGNAKSLSTSTQYILRPNIINAINCDFKHEVGQYIHSYFAHEVTVANANGAYFGFKNIDLTNIKGLNIFTYAEKVYTAGGRMEVRLDAVSGEKLGEFNVKEGEFKTEKLSFTKVIQGKHDLYFVFLNPNSDNKALFGVTTVEFNTQ